MTHLTLKKWLPEGVSQQYDNIKAVIHEYPKTIPAVPESFKKVDHATTKDSISITWDLENFPKPESIQSIEQENLEAKSFAKAQETIENIIRSCNHPGMYIIRVATKKEASDRDFYASVKQTEKLVVISLSPNMIGDIKAERADPLFTVWHEMGHVIWKHGPEAKKNILRKMAHSKENNILYHFFSRSEERQANSFAFQNIDTLELENAQKYFKERTRKKIFKEKITNFFSETHPDRNEECEAAQEELQKRKIRIPRFHQVVAAENAVRNKKIW